MSSSSTDAAVNDDHDDDSVHVDSTKDSDDASTAYESFNAITIRHRGGFSLSTTSSFLPIFFNIQLYMFLLQLVKLGSGASLGAGV